MAQEAQARKSLPPGELRERLTLQRLVAILSSGRAIPLFSQAALGIPASHRLIVMPVAHALFGSAE